MPKSWMVRPSLAAASVFLTLTLAPAARADLLGPTPYLSFADSPFNGASFSDFHLENFEGGALSTPGVTASAGVVLPPGPQTDSVDGDDGVIDGSGQAGHSWYIGTTNTLTFTFNAAALGGHLPTSAGLAWTDVGRATPVLGFDNVTFSALDALGNSLGSLGPFLLGDGNPNGGTAEDRFFGVTNPGGISSITITMSTSTDWEVDHLQYGFQAVPEPSSLLLTGLGLAGLIGCALRRRQPTFHAYSDGGGRALEDPLTEPKPFASRSVRFLP